MVDLGPLRESRDFRLLFFGQLVSMIGNQLTLVAIPYEVFTTTHSNLWVGTVSLLQLPLLVLGSLWGGAVGDRSDRRRILALSALALCATSAGLAINAAQDNPSFVALLALAILASGLAGFSNPARNAAIPRLVRPEQLVGAYSLNQVIIQTATIVGPTLAGVLIAASGLATCYAIDALTFVGLFVMTALMAPMPPLEAVPDVRIRQSIKDGFSYVRTHVVAQCVYLVDLNAMIFGMPNSLFPYIAHSWYHGGPVVYGLLVSAPGVGALIGATTTGWVGALRRRGRAIVLAVCVWGGAIAVFGLVRTLWVGLVFLAVAGWADVLSAVMRNALLQSTITDEFRGRLSAIQMAVVQGGPRLGNFEAGVVSRLASTEFSVVSGGIASIAGAIGVALWRPQFWRESYEE
jgi:MFS family permease